MVNFIDLKTNLHTPEFIWGISKKLGINKVNNGVFICRDWNSFVNFSKDIVFVNSTLYIFSNGIININFKSIKNFVGNLKIFTYDAQKSFMDINEVYPDFKKMFIYDGEKFQDYFIRLNVIKYYLDTNLDQRYFYVSNSNIEWRPSESGRACVGQVNNLLEK